MPIIDHPKFGPTEFPDSMSQDEIIAALKKMDAQAMSSTQGPTAEQLMRDPAMQAAIARAGGGTIVPGPGISADAAKAIAGMGVEGGLTAAGQAAGMAFAGPPGASVGGAITAPIGYALNKLIKGETPTMGGAAGSAVMGAVPGSPLAGLGMKGMAKEGLKQIGAGLGAETAEALVEGKAPTAQGVAARTGGAMIGLIGGKAFDFGQAADRQTAKEVTQLFWDDALKKAQEKGLAVLPSMANGVKLNKLLESMAGKTRTIAEINDLNNELFTTLTMQAVGLQPQLGVQTKKILGQAVEEAARPYAEIRALAQKAEADLVALKKNRLTASNEHELNVQMADPEFVRESSALAKKASVDVDKYRLTQEKANNYLNSTSAAEKELGKKYQEEAAGYLKDIESGLKEMGREDLLNKFQAARKRLAQLGEVEQALTPGGTVDMAKLRRSAESGTPFTGDLKTLAMFASDPRFRYVTQSNLRLPPSEMGGIQEVGQEMFRTPIGSLIQSPFYQRTMAQPSYTAMPDFVSRFMKTATQSELDQRLSQPNSLLQFYQQIYPRKPEQQTAKP